MSSARTPDSRIHAAGGRPAWVVERALFALPVTVGVGVLGAAGELFAATPIGLIAVVAATSGYLVCSLLVGVGCWLDARRLRRLRGGWSPRGWLWAVASLLIAPLVGVAYLHRRHARVGTVAAADWWWAVVVVGLVLPVVGLLTAAGGALLSVPALVGSGLALAGVVTVGAVPGALYLDASLVRTDPNPWRPNPALYLGLALVGLSLFPLQPGVSAYYLGQRRRYLGGP